MRKVLPMWCKQAKITMIMKDLREQDVTAATGYTRQHVNAVLNGRMASYTAIKRISDLLGISDEYPG